MKFLPTNSEVDFENLAPWTTWKYLRLKLATECHSHNLKKASTMLNKLSVFFLKHTSYKLDVLQTKQVSQEKKSVSKTESIIYHQIHLN